MSISDDYQTRFGVHPVPTHVRAAFQALERSPDRPPAEVLAPFNLSTDDHAFCIETFEALQARQWGHE